jgi:signal transduction histidine kinase/DNA-binding response OmpR family regulator
LFKVNQFLVGIDNAFSHHLPSKTFDVLFANTANATRTHQSLAAFIDSMNASQFTVLIVEDDQSSRDLLAASVEMQGYQVITAQNGLEALNYLRYEIVDLMLLDIMMPVMDGYEVLQHMQSDPELNRTPVIVLSALTDVENLVRCVELGAEDCLFKPINTSLFWARINAALEKKRLQDQERLFAEELATLQQLDRALNKTLDLKRVANITLNWAMQQTGSVRGAIGGWQNSRFDSWADQGMETAVFSEETDCFEETFKQKHIRIISSENQPHRLCAPIQRDSQQTEDPLGLIVLECEWPFSKRDEQFLSKLCNHAAIAIKNAQLHTQIQTANRAKTDFVAMVSHELKSPLTVMRSYLELFAIINDGKLSEKQVNFLKTMDESVTRMNTLISELDDITRIETNNIRLHLEPVPLHDVVSEVSAALGNQLNAKQQTFIVNIPVDLPPLWADRKRIEQILHNLLSNAHKYVPEQGEIRVIAKPILENERYYVEVAVEDNGIGIPEEAQSKIFTQFYRTEQTGVTAVSGTGLGLNITKMLVELQGGRIWFTSKLNEGSTFYFLLPAAPSIQSRAVPIRNKQSIDGTVLT